MSDATKLTGRFVWHDLMSTDSDRALAFYQSLFPEWSISELNMGDAGVYHMIEVGGCQTGGIVSVSGDVSAPSHWISYVAVEDCDATVSKCEQIGGTVASPPVSIPSVGKFGVIRDDQGADIMPFQAEKELTRPDPSTAGHFVWHELMTRDVTQARSFYQTLFGWSSFETASAMGTYVMYRIGDEDIAGSLALPPDAQSPPNWLPYMLTPDIDDRSKRVEDLGGVTFVPPTDIPDIGRFAVHADPTGASFALFRRAFECS